jgi:hypothetical protein
MSNIETLKSDIEVLINEAVNDIQAALDKAKTGISDANTSNDDAIAALDAEVTAATQRLKDTFAAAGGVGATTSVPVQGGQPTGAVTGQITGQPAGDVANDPAQTAQAGVGQAGPARTVGPGDVVNTQDASAQDPNAPAVPGNAGRAV